MTQVWAAFSIIWLAIFVYTLVLGRRQEQLLAEIRLLKKAVQESGDKTPGR